MNTKEQWINKTMESLDGIGRAGLSPFIREKILQNVHTPLPEQISVKFLRVWKIAAAIILLISLNIFTLIHLQRSSGTIQNPLKSVASEYFLYIDTYNL